MFPSLLPHSCKMTSDSFETNYWALREISIFSLFIETALCFPDRGGGWEYTVTSPLVHRALRSLALILEPTSQHSEVSQGLLLSFPLSIRFK